MLRLAEYIWLDGSQPTQRLRSKARVVFVDEANRLNPDFYPEWGFDGSSTGQALTKQSDCLLKPIRALPCPLRKSGDVLLLCEVLEMNGAPHATNTRAKLRELLGKAKESKDFWIGFEQEYTLYQGKAPLGWPKEGFPAPQGPYYCGVGADVAFGRPLVEAHTRACMEAGLMIYGINAEVMPSQWEFQIGYRGLEGESADALSICDQRYLALWLLYRLGEDFNISVSLSNKPVKGDWNGTGCHTNFSTEKMRNPRTGKESIQAAIEALRKNHDLHIPLYGEGLAERLTGKHETADIGHFSANTADRSSSIRIPPSVAEKGYGYLEDRRPGANCDAYLVAGRILATLENLEAAELSQNYALL